jgi:hypothetical protein
MSYADWDKENLRPHWFVRLEMEGRTEHFDFWGAVGDQEIALGDLLDCLSGDALIGEGTFEDYCSDIGADEDSRRAYQTWEACRDAAQRLQVLFGDHYEEFLHFEQDEANTWDGGRTYLFGEPTQEEDRSQFQHYLEDCRLFFDSEEWGYGPDDAIAKREHWNNLTDLLCKEGTLTQLQYETWDNPF